MKNLRINETINPTTQLLAFSRYGNPNCWLAVNKTISDRNKNDEEKWIESTPKAFHAITESKFKTIEAFYITLNHIQLKDQQINVRCTDNHFSGSQGHTNTSLDQYNFVKSWYWAHVSIFSYRIRHTIDCEWLYELSGDAFPIILEAS